MDTKKQVSLASRPLGLLLIRSLGTFHPRHVVQATGLNGEPRVPFVPGVKSFKGITKHSTEFFTGTSKYAGKKVVVIGAGNSGHDIAHDAYRHGAEVTIIQRSPSYVVTQSACLKMILPRYNDYNVRLSSSPVPSRV
jgi:cation diffusion facilitator CzcD-associated flavoprotein CzcO